MSETLSQESVKELLEAVKMSGELFDMKDFEKYLKKVMNSPEASTAPERTLNLEKN